MYNQAPDTISIYDSSSSISCFLNIDNCLINLDKNTVKYQPAKAEIIGNSRIGEPININLKEVKSIAINDSEIPGWVIIVGVSVIFLGIIIAGIASSFRLPIGR